MVYFVLNFHHNCAPGLMLTKNLQILVFFFLSGDGKIWKQFVIFTLKFTPLIRRCRRADTSSTSSQTWTWYSMHLTYRELTACFRLTEDLKHIRNQPYRSQMRSKELSPSAGFLPVWNGSFRQSFWPLITLPGERFPVFKTLADVVLVIRLQCGSRGLIQPRELHQNSRDKSSVWGYKIWFDYAQANAHVSSIRSERKRERAFKATVGELFVIKVQSLH